MASVFGVLPLFYLSASNHLCKVNVILFFLVVCSSHSVFNFFNSSMRGIKLMQNGSSDSEFPLNIPRFMSIYSVYIIFPSVCKRILVFQ